MKIATSFMPTLALVASCAAQNPSPAEIPIVDFPPTPPVFYLGDAGPGEYPPIRNPTPPAIREGKFKTIRGEEFVFISTSIDHRRVHCVDYHVYEARMATGEVVVICPFISPCVFLEGDDECVDTTRCEVLTEKPSPAEEIPIVD